jgi:hypothetical protein
MNELQQTIIKPAIPPAAIKDNAAFSSLVIDLVTDFPGCNYVEFAGQIGATDIALAALKVVESDTKTNSTTLGGTPADVDAADTLPGAGDDNKTFVFGIDLSNGSRQRYLQLQATAGDGTAGTFLSAIAIGYRPAEAGSSATKRGALFAQYT